MRHHPILLNGPLAPSDSLKQGNPPFHPLVRGHIQYTVAFGPKLIEGFRVLKADGCEAAFHSPLTMKLSGRMIGGAKNTVSLRVASVPDFLVMKSIALARRDKPKDACDICYCLDHFNGGIPQLAKAWRTQMVAGSAVARSVEILREKFESVDSYGPMQVVEFHNETDDAVREEQSRRAFELERRFLTEVESENQA